MSPETPPPIPSGVDPYLRVSEPDRFTTTQWMVIAISMAKAFLLYLDRTCMGAVVQSAGFQAEMALDKAAVGSVMAAFFFAYALGQIPAGWMADRFGPRRMLVLYVVLWSICTALTGWASSLAILVGVRIACGLAEAGAYPAMVNLVGSWFDPIGRARASGMVAMGGRMGNALALGITASAISWFGGWRPVLWVYGLLGLFLAAIGWRILRDSPQPQAARPSDESFPWGTLLRSRGLWIFNLGSIGMNLGWAFLITWLPTYLGEVRGMDSAVSLKFISWALAFGMTGMLFGGWFGDACVRRYGTLWGRRIPIISGSILAAASYLVAPLLPKPEWTIAACGIVAFASDSITPSIWGMVQDIGGKKSASTMAWVNMWGNLGASVVAKIIPLFLASRWHQQNWGEIFMLCATGFAVLGISALAVDTRHRVET